MNYAVAPMEGAIEEGVTGPWICLAYIGPCETLIICGIYIPWEEK